MRRVGRDAGVVLSAVFSEASEGLVVLAEYPLAEAAVG